jgi:hypothetical protein
MFKSNKLENKKFITVKNTSNVTLHGVAAGDQTKVETDGQGIPLDPNWRRRIRDSHIDGCVEVVKTKSSKKAKED